MSSEYSTGLTVLLIEDRIPEVDYIREILSQVQSCHFSITHADRLDKGLELLEQMHFDVLLLDLCLPDSTGYITFQTAHNSFPAVPIILITNINDETLAARAVREGAQDYLIKRKMDSELLSRAIRYAVERQNAEEALRISEERYALAVRGANDGIWDWDLDKGDAYYSERWHSILGFDENLPATINSWTDRIHEDDKADFNRALEAHLAGNTSHFSHEYRILTKDYQYIWVLSRGIAVTDHDGHNMRMAGSITDISKRKQAESQLVHDALHDDLTGLPNRNLMTDRLDHAIQRIQGRGEHTIEFALLFLDLDRFKNINDSLGHSVGDELLVLIANKLRDIIRPGDTVARLGGDEFAILLTEVNTLSMVTHVADRVLTECAMPVVINSHEISTTVSIGIALGTKRYTSSHEVLRDADLAMYWAKSEGKACYEIFDREMHSRVVKLQRIEHELRQAVEKNEFIIHYQPIVSLLDDSMVGFEALIRWNHPERGLVGPVEFISIAEETGLIVPLGWWTLREACHQARKWQRAFPTNPPLSISVNISGKLFNQPDMITNLRKVLKETDLPATSLRLEITESVLLDHADESLAKLDELRNLGVGLHVDDFGTGYSSLSYLQKFNYDTLKIDRSFVNQMNTDKGSGAIVQTIIALGKLLDMNIIAEGVENRTQLERLKELKCPQVQGFLFSKPVDSISATRILSTPAGYSGNYLM
ncbi:MAG: EAL domain-containing protein [Pseudomonadota bacterium]|nr:EAL domain-containing protein [Pseudomonadota bacterium]